MNYCGLDLGKLSSHYCIVDADRKVLREKRVATDAKSLRKAFILDKPMKVVVEASTKAFWVADILTKMGHEVVVVDPRKTKAIGSALIKHDRLDARVLATLGQADVLAPVGRPSFKERCDRMPIVARDALVRARTKLINATRGMLDSEGVEVASCDTGSFTTVVREHVTMPAAIAAATEPLLMAIDGITEAIEEADVAVQAIASSNEVMVRLQTVDGVGPIVATSFVNAIGDPTRFKSSRQVGAYLGLVPSLYQSGATERTGRITKLGNRQARYALTIAANALLRAKRNSDLKTWGLRLIERLGRRKAIVALARKLAGVLWSMWKKNAPFRPSKTPASA